MTFKRKICNSFTDIFHPAHVVADGKTTIIYWLSNQRSYKANGGFAKRLRIDSAHYVGANLLYSCSSLT